MKIYRWRKRPHTGAHIFIYGGKRHRVLPGETVEAPVEAMGSCSLEYECLGEDVHPFLAAQQELDDYEPVDFVLQSRGGGWYDVIHPNNPEKPINDEAMRKAGAEELLKTLNSDE